MSNEGGWIPSLIDNWHPGMSGASWPNSVGGGGTFYTGGDGGGTVRIKYQEPTDKDNDMAFTNPQAAEIAREILDEQTKGELRSTVEAAVHELTNLLADTDCGSTLTFVKHNDGGQHYYYAAVKSGGKWYTTAERPRVLRDDAAMIEWLIGLEIYAGTQLELHASSTHEPHAIEASAVEA